MNKLYKAFIVVFVILLMAPAVAMPLFKNQENTEKRELQSFPKLIVDGKFNKHYTSEFDAWLGDHIGFRNVLVKANSYMKTGLFGESSEDSVILGNDGWLFYANTVNDYLNIATISDRNARNIAKTYSMVQKYAKDNAAKFTMTIAPNKNSVYPDKMPYNYVKTDGESNYDKLKKELDKAEVNYADLEKAIKAEKETLYQVTDSHWNYKGALVGYRTIMDTLEINYNKFNDLKFTTRKDWNGDLAKMLYASSTNYDNQTYPDYEFNYEITSHETAVDSIMLETANQKGNGNLLLFRDSFCNTMQVYFEENFAYASVTREYPFPVNDIKRISADAVVLEIVERNIPNLAKKAPIMEAPKVDLDAKADKLSTYEAYCDDYSNEFLHVYGSVDKKVLGDEYNAYILIANGLVSSAYEAFPIYEQELMNKDKLDDNGFSAYINKENVKEKSKIYVVIESGDKCYISNAISY